MAEGGGGAGGVEVARAWVTIIPTTEGAQGAVEKAIVPASESAGKKGSDSMGTAILAGLKKYAAPIAAVFTIGAAKSFADSSVSAFTDLASQTKGLQRIIGGTAEEVSSLSGAMKLSGMDTDKANTSLTIFSKKLNAAASDGDAAAAMGEKLGTSILDADGNMRSMNEILPDVADTFASMPDGAEKTALACELFGKSGTAMLPFLNKGSEGISELEAKAKELGITLDDDSMSKFGAYKAALREWDTAMQGVKVTLGEALIPFITGASSAMTDVFMPAIQATIGGVSDFFTGLSSAIDFDGFSAAFESIGAAVASAFPSDGGGAATFGETVGNAVNGLVPIVEGAAPVIGELASAVKWVSDNADVAVPMIGAFALGIKAIQMGQGAAPLVTGIANAIGSSASRAAGAIAGLFGTAAAEEATGAASATASGPILEAAVAVVALGAGVLLASAGLWVLAQAAISIAESGPGAAVAMGALVLVVAALAVGAAVLGPALTAGAVGMVAFGAAVLMVGAGVLLASAGLALVCTQLPVLAEYGLAAAGAAAALGAGLLVMGAGALVAGVGCIALAAGVVLASVGMAAFAVATLVASVPMLLLAASAPIVAMAFATMAPMSLVLGAGLLVMGAGGLVAAAAMVALGASSVAGAAGLVAFGAALGDVPGRCATMGQGLAQASAAMLIIPVQAAMASASLKAMGAASSAVGTRMIKDFTMLATGVQASMTAAVAAVSTACYRMKSEVGGMRLTIPRIEVASLPHFSLRGKFDPEHNEVPTVSVDWYAKGGYFDRPTIIGVGEKGGEHVLNQGHIDALSDELGAKSATAADEVVDWLADNLPHIIATYTPKLGERDFDRRARQAYA